MTYTRAIKPNSGLDQVNVFAVDCGTPALASANRIVTTTNMKVGAYTIANASSADGLPRNVTCTRAVVTGADTAGTVLVTGTDVAGNVITETLIPGADTVVVAGLKAFKTVTSVVGAGWVINTGNDTIVFGFGTLVGLPSTIRATKFKGNGALAGAAQVFGAWLGGTAVSVVVTYDAADISLCTIDASAGTYNGTKRLYALTVR
jgi:archaellum component FlaF (FlaF/FlaG flagellin family)